LLTEEYTNSLGQKICFVEHPIYGFEYFVICMCIDLKLACDSTFFEIDDMIQEHKEYEPTFVDGELFIGGFPC
jgi:hypothetical protein